MSTTIPFQGVMFHLVETPADIQIVADLAVPIWREQFTPIIGSEQVAYMLEAWQSPAAIKDQMHQGTRYYLVELQQTPIGYLAWIPTEDGNAKISKFYLLHDYHGQGYAGIMMSFIEQKAREAKMQTLWLQVNRHNHRAIAFYRKCGFQTLRDRLEEIAPGYYIDDHIMEKSL